MTIYADREEAREAGEKYYTGKPCVKCGDTTRYVSSDRCVECARNNSKKWKEKNPEKVKANSKKYYAENTEKVKVRNKKYYAENRERVKSNNKKWKEKNPDYDKKWREKNPDYNKKWVKKNPEKVKVIKRKYYVENREKMKVNDKKWKEKNPEKVRQYIANRKAAKLQRTPPWVDHDAIAVFYAEAARLTVETGIEHHVDHIIPLQGKLVSGLHVHTNLQVITAEENLKKNNSFTIE